MEREYYSNCCDAPPVDYEVVDVCENKTGYCQKCRSGAKFYYIHREKIDMNTPEIAEIIEEATEEVEKEYRLKKVEPSELKIYVSMKGKIYYELNDVRVLKEKYNKLVDEVNERNGYDTKQGQ